jgi:hypothetical protein
MYLTNTTPWHAFTHMLYYTQIWSRLLPNADQPTIPCYFGSGGFFCNVMLY